MNDFFQLLQHLLGAKVKQKELDFVILFYLFFYKYEDPSSLRFHSGFSHHIAIPTPSPHKTQYLNRVKHTKKIFIHTASQPNLSTSEREK